MLSLNKSYQSYYKKKIKKKLKKKLRNNLDFNGGRKSFKVASQKRKNALR
jgi:hypothetical protein